MCFHISRSNGDFSLAADNTDQNGLDALNGLNPGPREGFPLDEGYYNPYKEVRASIGSLFSFVGPKASDLQKGEETCLPPPTCPFLSFKRSSTGAWRAAAPLPTVAGAVR
jgi:hypothetical protein